jgi:uncharacterized membrane protein YphA (DoxX/SURF4 family)
MARNRGTFEAINSSAIPGTKRGGRRGPQAILWPLRIVVGGYFAFSGFLKINNVMGFSNKLEKYWIAFEQAMGIGFTALQPLTPSMAGTLAVVETLMGFYLILGIARRTTASLYLIMIVMFTFLTGWAAITGSVTDCGCFGDFIKLSPWVSFLKDIILLVLIAPIFIWRDSLYPLIPSKYVNYALSWLLLLGVVGFTYYTTANGPMIDNSPCAIGNDLRAQTNYNAATESTPLAGYAELTAECDGADEFQGLSLLIFMKDMTHVANSDMTSIGLLANELDGKVNVYGLTSTPERVRVSIINQSDLKFCISGQDMDMIKTCVTTNVAYVLLKNGIVRGKWQGSMPTPEEVIAAGQ